MRPFFALLLATFAALAGAQLRPGEAKALDDAMTLANVRSADLGFVTPPNGAQAAQVAALRDPISGLLQANALHQGATGDEVSLLRTALGLVGGGSVKPSKGEVADLPPSVPSALRRPVGTLVAAIARADDEIRASLARLSASERRTLIEALPRLAAEDPTLPLDFAHGPSPDFATVRRLLDLVDSTRIEVAGVALARTVRETIPALQSLPNKGIARQLFRSSGVLVELAGNGPDVHDRRDVNLCIDLGGDDRYTGRYGAGIGYASVLIDLSGNDRYIGPDANFGTGILGIGLAYDLGGDDAYGVRSCGLGCGLAGVGMLFDGAGDDRYRVVALGLGAGARGIGLLNDRLGDDAYESGRAGEGFGTLGGVGWSVDGAGDDTYRGGEWVQATGRETGFGLLTDLGGDDDYRCQSGQAAAWGGYASLGDSKGDDQYVALGDAQAFSAAGGFAALIDSEGNDSYLLRRGSGQAAAFGAVAILFDRAGDDVYGGTDGSPASAEGGGVAILLEGEGDDRYLSSAPFRKDPDGVALWADGGGRDQYGDGRSDAQATASLSAAALDEFGASEIIGTPKPLPAPGSIPMPSAAAFEILRRRAIDGPDRAGAVAEIVGIGMPALNAMASEPDDAFVAVASRLGAAAAPTVAKLAGSSNPRIVRAALATAGFVPIPDDVLITALGRPETSIAAAEAAGRSRAKAAIPALTALAGSGSAANVRAAMVALAAIGDPASAGTAASLVDSPDLVVRQAAFRLVVLQPATATSTGLRLARSTEVFSQRIGLALLGEVRSAEALAALGRALQGSRDAKIGALLALDGHVPTDMIAAVEALRRDGDPLVRAVAERTNVGP